MTANDMMAVISLFRGGPRVFICSDWSTGTLYIITHRQHRRKFRSKANWVWLFRPVGIRWVFRFVGHAKLRALTKGHQLYTSSIQEDSIPFRREPARPWPQPKESL